MVNWVTTAARRRGLCLLERAYGPLLAFQRLTSFTIGFGAAVAASAISFSYALRVVPVHDESGWIAKGLATLLYATLSIVEVQTGGRPSWYSPPPVAIGD